MALVMCPILVKLDGHCNSGLNNTEGALTNGDPCMSALAEHAINHHHDIAWEDAIVVDADPHMYRRRTLEAWHIRQEPNPMNRDRGLLLPVYDSLIRTHPPPDTQ